MKKMFLMLLTFAMVAGVSYAGGADEIKSPSGVAIVRAGSTFKVFYKAPESGKVRISIFDERGTRVFYESFRNTDGFMRPYNFAALEKGQYSIHVEDANGLRIETVFYASEKPSRIANLDRLGESTQYLLSVPNKGAETLTVRILTENGTELYRKTEKVIGDFARLYNVKGVSGKISFVITDKTGTVISAIE